MEKEKIKSLFNLGEAKRSKDWPDYLLSLTAMDSEAKAVSPR
ncbi:hypothetical protein [Solemya pervernicosa gill symbiont]|nr:hypothetical protein [Solemya pervernicosa gill symbiont]